MCGGPFSRSFIQKYPASSPPFISFSLLLSLLAIQQVDHRAYAAPSTVGPTQLPRVTSWLRGLLCNKSEFPQVSFRGSRVLRDFPRVSLSFSLSLFHLLFLYPYIPSTPVKSTTPRPLSGEFWRVVLCADWGIPVESSNRIDVVYVKRDRVATQIAIASF